MSVNRLTFATLAIACTLVACKQPDPAPAETEEPPATAPAATGTEVTRQEQPAEPAPSSGPIASQPGAKGSTWELTRAAVAGQILTVQFTVKTAGKESLFRSNQKIDEISLIDDATSQRYSVLKDDSGRPMASPVNADALNLGIGAGSSGVVWLKFPAPPAGSNTVSINIPDVGPFDAVPVKR